MMSTAVATKTSEVITRQGQINLLALHQSQPQRYPFLLQSTALTSDQNHQSRYDILFAFPQQTLSLNNRNELSGIENIAGNDFLDNLNRWWQSDKHYTVSGNTGLPFTGGWFLYLGYELANQVETRLNLSMPDTNIAYATRIPAAIIYDHKENLSFLIAEDKTSGHIDKIQDDIISVKQSNYVLPELELTEDKEDKYLEAIKKVKQYIFDGDVFQVNLSRGWQSDIPGKLEASVLYKQLCKTNPAPFAGLAVYDELSIISSSPERLVKVKNNFVETRPIAGTRRRDNTEEKDTSLKNELMANAKERAEHIMLIDLERNDLGRVCKPGSIIVNDLMSIESYAHVHHIVSNVMGEIKNDVLPGDIIRAVFPGGTITGCPKERCMAIISELENTHRGCYTGSMGYLNHDGSMDLNILIRTMSITDNKLSFRAGAGLVADSVAERELEETRHKAKGLLMALQ